MFPRVRRGSDSTKKTKKTRQDKPHKRGAVSICPHTSPPTTPTMYPWSSAVTVSLFIISHYPSAGRGPGACVFLCMPATVLQGNRCRRLQCTSPYVITALIKAITAAHSSTALTGSSVGNSSISSHLDVHFLRLQHSHPSPESCEASRFPQYVCKCDVYVFVCVCLRPVLCVCVYAPG